MTAPGACIYTTITANGSKMTPFEIHNFQPAIGDRCTVDLRSTPAVRDRRYKNYVTKCRSIPSASRPMPNASPTKSER